MGSKMLRCAIYTRKSSEEGLDQAFNSLDAQRDACEAFIRSQAPEGWKLVRTAYDDGGFSGGNTERPALKALLADIEAGRVDVVVVYKVDRLTRSLADFARIVELFDRQGASFVSVTQQFNTTSSMGRLTLNVLLSFAQFEREVTGERIRDKIAASKRKGMWMGGYPPFGYDVVDRKLIPNVAEVLHVMAIFERYLELESVRLLQADLAVRGVLSKAWTSRRGNARGGAPFGRGALYALLRSRIYVGEISHKGEIHAGEHRAIVDRALFDQVQQLLQENRQRELGAGPSGQRSRLGGLIFDADGNRMTPSDARKRDGRRYRYYVSRPKMGDVLRSPGTKILRIPAFPIEELVADRLTRLQATEQALRRIVVQTDEVEIWLDRSASVSVDAVPDGDRATEHDDHLRLTVPVQLRQYGGEKRLVALDGQAAVHRPVLDRSLIKAIVRAHRWMKELTSGTARSINDIARREKLGRTYVQRIVPLGLLAPDITQAILSGRQPPHMTIDRLVKTVLPIEWAGQRALLLRPPQH